MILETLFILALSLLFYLALIRDIKLFKHRQLSNRLSRLTKAAKEAALVFNKLAEQLNRVSERLKDVKM